MSLLDDPFLISPLLSVVPLVGLELFDTRFAWRWWEGFMTTPWTVYLALCRSCCAFLLNDKNELSDRHQQLPMIWRRLAETMTQSTLWIRQPHVKGTHNKANKYDQSISFMVVKTYVDHWKRFWIWPHRRWYDMGYSGIPCRIALHTPKHCLKWNPSSNELSKYVFNTIRQRS